MANLVLCHISPSRERKTNEEEDKRRLKIYQKLHSTLRSSPISEDEIWFGLLLYQIWVIQANKTKLKTPEKRKIKVDS